MESIFILVCFLFSPGGPDECGIATLTPRTANDNTPEMVLDAYCTKARGLLADNYPDAEITTCELWLGTPLGGREV